MRLPINKWRTLNRGSYKVILAETPWQKAQGLQGIKSLPRNTVVLFTNIPADHYFHTINCHFPIDIVSIDAYGKVLSIWSVPTNRVQVGPTPPKTAHVLEAPAGWSRSKGVGIGGILTGFNV